MGAKSVNTTTVESNNEIKIVKKNNKSSKKKASLPVPLYLQKPDMENNKDNNNNISIINNKRNSQDQLNDFGIKRLKYEPKTPTSSFELSKLTISIEEKDKENIKPHAEFGLFNRYLYCSKCKNHFDLSEHLPVVVTCENDLCLKCVKNSNFLVDECLLCKKKHVKNKKEYSLSLAIIRLLKDINNKQSQIEEDTKKKLDVVNRKLTTSLYKFDSIKEIKLNLFEKHYSDTVGRYELIIRKLNELKTKYVQDYEESLANMNSYFNDNAIILNSKNALISNFEEMKTNIRSENECNELIEKFQNQLKKYNDLLQDLDLNANCLFEIFKKKHEEDFESEFFAELKKLTIIKENQQSNDSNDIILYEPSEPSNKLNKHFYPLRHDLYFDYCGNKYDPNFTIFKIIDENFDLIQQMDVFYSFDNLKLVGKSIENEGFYIYFSNNKPNEYLIIKYSNEKLSQQLINTSRTLLNINSIELLLFSARKRAIFGLNHQYKKEFEIKEMDDLNLSKYNFISLGTNQDKIYLIQDNKIKILNKRTNAFTNTIEFSDSSSNVMVKKNLDNNIIIINKVTKQLKIIDSDNGNVLEEQILKIPNDFDDVQITLNNKLAFIYYKPEISVKFL